MSPNVLSVKKNSLKDHTKIILLLASLEHGREAAQSLAKTIRQFMSTMATTGMAADSSGSESPSTLSFPLLAERPAYEEEEKHDYGADDEEDDDEYVDNSFDCIPPNSPMAASESSKDFDDEVDQEQFVEKDLLGTDGNVSMESLLTTKDNVVGKVDVEHHTIIPDTTVVKKYSQVADEEVSVDENSDNVQSMNKLMVVTVCTSPAMINQQTSSTLGSAATGEGTSISPKGNSEDVEMAIELQDKPEIGSLEKSEATIKADVVHAQRSPTKRKGERTESDEGVVDEVLEEHEEKQDIVHARSDTRTLVAPVVSKSTKPVKAPVQTSKLVMKKMWSRNGDEEQTGDSVEIMATSEEVVSETLSSGEIEAAKHMSQAPNQRQPQKSKQSLQPKDPVSKPTAPVKIKTTNSSLSSPKSIAPPTTSPANTSKTLKKKQDVTPCDSAPTMVQGSNTSPKSSRKRTPVTPARSYKELKRAALKKQKNSLSAIDSDESGHAQSPPLRRSSRIKNEPPKFTYPVMRLADETVLSHFERTAENDASGSDAPRMTCKYCGKMMTASRGMAKRHLKSCLAFSSHGQALSQMVETSTVEDKHEFPSSTSSEVMKLVQLMGTEDLAAKLKGAFDHVPFTGDAPIARFQEVIKDDIKGLRNLNVLKLLDAVDPRDGPAIQLHVKLPGTRRSTGQDQLHPVSMAKARALEKCTLRFPAPRSVAEQFIVPLAKELGLEYAMRQHTASLVNCPKNGSVLDWRFLRTETVVFQLSGKSLWKLKMGQVEHPLQDFQPHSWVLDATAQLAKVHQVAAINKGAIGFLAPPGEDLDIFDENKSGDVVDKEQLEHILKPGSVAYVPAGTWFEMETEGPNVLWLEVNLASMTYEDLALSALKQLAWGDKQWRMKVQLYPGNRSHLRSRRHHMEACIKSLRNEMAELDGGDLLPEYLSTEDLQNFIAQGLIRDVNTSSYTTNIEVDLTNPKFKMKHEKVFKDAAYRVNPVAVLMSTDEIPHLSIEDEDEGDAGNGRASNTTPKHRALKRISKPKRKQALRVISQTGKHTYILDELFGNAEFQPNLHVKFQCSSEQSRLVEWLRCRGSEPFGLVEFSHGDDLLRHGKSPAHFEESARNLLRFLYFVGYVTQVKTP